MILKLLAVLVVTLAEVAVVTAVAVTPAAHTVSSTLTLHALVSPAGVSQGLLVLITNGALTELTDESLLAAKVD